MQHEQLSTNKQALLKIRELKKQLEELEARQPAGQYEPIAVVSMACRFPRQSRTPELFWQSLIDGVDEVSDIPDSRWDPEAFHDDDPDAPGKMYAKRGVFLDDLDLMDPEFFGISPREATWVDPQQRLLMEVGWEAIERAGWVPDEIAEATGVFVGWMHNDYQNEASDSFLNLNPYIATGAAGSFLCGRLAYHLGLHGPSLAVDTACSSSLVALHLAIQSLQRHDCDRALVGGVNAICSPTTNILTCKLKALSPTGQSRAFDAAADGYLRGEGCGVVTLRRLADAENGNDPILGVIRGSAIGHNGAGGGLTVPNPRAQEQVIRKAVEHAGIEPEMVAYLEAHGTGTELGDPIEMQAAAASLAGDRTSSNPLLVGSVKTNIGHLEAAAGMAGLIKVLLSIRHEKIAGQLNFENPNPRIAWDSLPVKVLSDATDWPVAGRRIAGVSAFGMSGTNAHVVVESPSSESGNASPKIEQSYPIVISAKSEDALFELAGRYADFTSPANDIGDGGLRQLAYTTGCCRSHFEHRASFVASSWEDAGVKFRRLANGDASNDVVAGSSGRQKPRVAWQFTGQGAQYVGMARGLYDRYAVFRAVIDECDGRLTELRPNSKHRLKHVLFEHPSLINDTTWTQPAIFSVQRGLVELLQSWDMHPDAVLGHSVGQYAAACVAGVMTWDEGLRLISERGRLIGELPTENPRGCMMAVFGDATEAGKEVFRETNVSQAAFNGTHIVVSGPEPDMERARQIYESHGLRTKRLTTSHAFHSSMMQPALKPFKDFANSVEFQPPKLPLICNVTGEVLPVDRRLDGAYWAMHILKPVLYSKSVDLVRELGCDAMLEIGPQSILTRMAAANWSGSADSLVSCQEKKLDADAALHLAISQLYVKGVTPSFRKLHADYDGRPMLLPTYPFQRKRFWGPDKPRAAHAAHHTAHPLLGGPVGLAGVSNETRFESHMDVDSPAWLPDHQLMGSVVMPGAAFVELALAAAEGKPLVELSFEQPLRPSGRTALQTVLRSANDGNKTAEESDKQAKSSKLEVWSSDGAGQSANWTRNFSAAIVDENSGTAGTVDLASLQGSLKQSKTPEEFYDAMSEFGLGYGPAFQTIDSLQYSDTEVLSRLRSKGDVRGYTIPPTILDGALHSLAVRLMHENDGNFLLPVGIGRFVCYRKIETEVWCHATWKDRSGKTRTADLTLFDDEGKVVASIVDLRVEEVSIAALRRMSGMGPERLTYQTTWEPLRLGQSTDEKTRWIVVGGGDSLAPQKIAGLLSAKDHDVTCVESSNDVVKDVVDEATSPDPQQGAQGLVASPTTSPITSPTTRFDGIAWIIPNTESPEATKQECENILAMLEALRFNDDGTQRKLECGLQFITQNAVSVESAVATPTTPNDGVPEVRSVQPHQSKFWGLAKVIGAERPGLRCRLIDVPSDAADSERVLSSVVDILLTETRDNQIAIRDQQLYVPRLQSAKKQRSEAFAARPGHCYLVTGGLGMLGRQVAKWLAEHNAEQVVLVSRRAPDDSMQAFVDLINESGCDAVIHSADISRRSDVESLFARFGSDLHPLAGVFHAAGVLDDGMLESQTWERFEKVLTPKVVAAELLDEFTRPLNLDLFVLYSSAASVFGSPGQSNYAMGNAFLDGLAWRRRQDGQPALSINWGPWTEGMADDERIAKRMALQRIAPLSVEDAHAAMESLISAEAIQATVIDAKWQRFQSGMGGGPLPLLEKLVGVSRVSKQADSALVGQLRTMDPRSRRDLLVQTIQSSLQSILGTTDSPDPERPLIEMGLDSLMAVEFGTALQQMFGDQFAISPAMLFDHPTIDAIVDHLLELIADSGPATALGMAASQSADIPATAVENERFVREDVAIVGLSCRFPGANNVDEFWNNLLNGVDSVRRVPDDRWDVPKFLGENGEPGKMTTAEGGFLDGIGDFDPAFFNISGQEACWIDPQHRMLLENCHCALEDAGIVPDALPDSKVGVFMGIMGQDYAFLPTLDDADVIDGFRGAGLSHSAGVGRISFVFGFEGPSVAIDTASSSSLVATLQAVRSLQERNCNLALAGGVNAILAPVNSLLMSKAGLLAPDGRCKSFSAQANGFGRGEGCGVVVLKRLSDAQRDGDRVMAVIRGGAVSHNGVSGGITAPSGKSQGKLIEQALRDARMAPSEVQYLEAHGTGTEFGDPMELSAAAAVYGKGRSPDDPLLVGSVKANISHLEAAGGVSGLIKTTLAIYHGVIPPQIHFDEPSPHIPWSRLPIKMVEQPMDWPGGAHVPDVERTASVTALGLVGTNAHLVLSSPSMSSSNDGLAAREGEAPSEPPESGTASTTLLPTATRSHEMLALSARSPVALSQLARDYVAYLNQHPDVELADVCFSAGKARRHYEYRKAIVGSTREQVIDELLGVAAVSRGGRGSVRAANHFDASPDLAARTEPRPPEPAGQSNGNGEIRIDASHSRNGSATFTSRVPEIAWWFPDASEMLPGETLQAARELFQSEPAVRELIDAFDKRLEEHHATMPDRMPLSLVEMFSGATAQDLETHRELLAYALQATLANLWMSWGIEADAIAGSGVGQLTAACVAGCLCFKDAMILASERAFVDRQSGNLSESLDAFEKLADDFNYYPPKLPLVCSMSADIVPIHRSLGGSYWREHLADNIAGDTESRDEAALQALQRVGCDVMLDFAIGCGGGDGGREADAKNTAPATVVCLTDGNNATGSLQSALGGLYQLGANPDFDGVHATWPHENMRTRLRLPHYPFQKQRYWITEIAKHMDGESSRETNRESRVSHG